MSKRVFLHIGLAKSGTSYLQAVLAENKHRLSGAGLLYPGASWDDQMLAVRDIRKMPGPIPEDSVGAWDRLRAKISAWDGNAVVSMEWLAGATSSQVRSIVESLAPASAHVIVTARDLGRTIPAAWQEFVQNNQLWTWQEFVRSVSSDVPRGTPAGNAFWAQQDLGKVLANWRDAVPGESMSVVTLPPPGAPAGELWARFATTLGVQGTLVDASARGANESLGRESAELMLRFNRLCRERKLDDDTYEEVCKKLLAKSGLAKRRHAETPMYRLPADLGPWARAKAQEQIDAVLASGASVVGELTDLQPDLAEADVSEAAPESDGLLDAALEGLLFLVREQGRELHRQRRRRARSPGGAASPSDETRPSTNRSRGQVIRRRAGTVVRRIVAAGRRRRAGN